MFQHKTVKEEKENEILIGRQVITFLIRMKLPDESVSFLDPTERDI